MDIVAQVREMTEPLSRARGLELLEVTFRREGRDKVLRLTIERENGATSVKDCAELSRALGPALENLVPSHFHLEVTSAGLDRPLRYLPDFRRNLGRLLRINARNCRPAELLGTLQKADEQGLLLELTDGTAKSLPLEDVLSARREVMFPRRSGDHR